MPPALQCPRPTRQLEGQAGLSLTCLARVQYQHFFSLTAFPNLLVAAYPLIVTGEPYSVCHALPSVAV